MKWKQSSGKKEKKNSEMRNSINADGLQHGKVDYAAISQLRFIGRNEDIEIFWSEIEILNFKVKDGKFITSATFSSN